MPMAEAIMCLALNIYHESKGESTQGKIAVAQVAVIRAENDSSEICNKVFKPYQFSWANSLISVNSKDFLKKAEKLIPKNDQAWKDSYLIAKMQMEGKIPTIIRATHFHSVHVPAPAWTKQAKFVGKIGNHKFYFMDNYVQKIAI